MNNNTFETVIKNTSQLICSEEFIQKHRIGHGFTRNRKLSFPDLIYFILSAGKKSIGINWAEVRHDFPSLNLPAVSKQAISKARQKFLQTPAWNCASFFLRYFIIIPIPFLYGMDITFMPLMVPRSRYRHQTKI